MLIPELPPRMRAWRYALRLSQEEAAFQVGVAPITYGAAERTGRMSQRTARAIEAWLQGASLVPRVPPRKRKERSA
jgi:transcriptional regulator with XRE-family HTH domain